MLAEYRTVSRRLPMLVSLLAITLTIPASGAELYDRARAIDTPTIGAEVKISGPIQLHQAKITPQAGTRAFQLLAGDEPCGIYLSGTATLDYTVKNRFSLPVAARNLRRASSLETTQSESSIQVKEEISDALIWSFGLNAPLAESSTAAPASPEWVSKIFERTFFSRPSLLLLAGEGIGSKSAIYGLFKGKEGVLKLEVDPAEQGVESLYNVEKDSYSKGHYLMPLAAQPIQRQWWDRFPSSLVAVEESIYVDNIAGKLVNITTDITLQATQDGVQLWRALLYSELYNGRTESAVVVDSVEVEGKKADFLHRDDQLLIALPKALTSGEKVRVRVQHHGDYAHKPAGDNYWVLGTSPWYPQPQLNGELATIDLKVRAPAPMIPMASGEEISRIEEDGYNIVTTRLDQAMQFPVVAVGKYELYSETRDGITCQVATYATGREKSAKRLINNFFASAKFYSELFAIPYPFQGFTIVELNTWGFGQAPPGLIFLTKEAFDAVSTSTGRYFSEGLNERFVHEVAHAWWGHVVKMDSLEEQWITESFATYASALCLRAMYGGKKGNQQFERMVKRWRGDTTGVGDGASVYLANYVAPKGYRDLDTRRTLLYSKGALVLQHLREELARRLGSQKEGDRYFSGFLRTYLANYKFQWGYTKNMVYILNQITQDEWQPWFEDYVYGTKVPEIQLGAK